MPCARHRKQKAKLRVYPPEVCAWVCLPFLLLSFLQVQIKVHLIQIRGPRENCFELGSRAHELSKFELKVREVLFISNEVLDLIARTCSPTDFVCSCLLSQSSSLREFHAHGN